ncbi:MAG: ankyrin repeat domain-containing protein [Candidatus Poribacteria bacterium]|nr:ankyrin repeat domain-containing protein [Candidatus Poribacteria bacterium]
MAKQPRPKPLDFLRDGVGSSGRGDLNRVKELLAEMPQWLNRAGSHGRTMLWEAAHRGKSEVVQYLAEQGADIDCFGCHYTPHFVEISAYCVARHHQRDAVADYLLSKGAKVDIHTAAYLCDLDGVKRFLAEDPSLLNVGHPQHGYEKGYCPVEQSSWATPLVYAARGGNHEVVRYLVDQGADVERISRELFIASNSFSLKKYFLENGANPAKFGETTNPAAIKLLEQYGIVQDMNARDKMGWPPIVYASRGDNGEHPEEIERLVKLGANIEATNSRGRTALHTAAKAGFTKTMEALLRHGANPNAVDDGGETPLFAAIHSSIKKTDRKIEAVRMLLAHDVDTQHRNAKERTALDLAEASGRDGSNEIAELIRRAQ